MSYLKLGRDCSASNMFVTRGMSNSVATIRALSHKFVIRLETSNNALIRALLASDIKWLPTLELITKCNNKNTCTVYHLRCS